MNNDFLNLKKIENGIGFVAFPNQKELLLSEIKNRFNYKTEPSEIFGNLIFFENRESFLNASKNKFPFWARTVLKNPFAFNFESISKASNVLKEIQRNWAPIFFTNFRRGELIQSKLPYINLRERKFPVEIPKTPMGIYTLLDNNTILASAETSSFLPAGELCFTEDHENPPSRAYLKIQEGLTMAKLLLDCELPSENSRCFEAGASPGGWTFVIAGLGSKVFAVDRAELSPLIMKNPLVEFYKHDAFTLKPEEIGNVDWVFSDVICYPERLLKWIQNWIQSGLAKNMMCTIKMQGEINWNLISEFESIKNSKVIHLNYNKHELTWLYKSCIGMI